MTVCGVVVCEPNDGSGLRPEAFKKQYRTWLRSTVASTGTASTRLGRHGSEHQCTVAARLSQACCDGAPATLWQSLMTTRRNLRRRRSAAREPEHGPIRRIANRMLSRRTANRMLRRRTANRMLRSRNAELTGSWNRIMGRTGCSDERHPNRMLRRRDREPDHQVAYRITSYQ